MQTLKAVIKNTCSGHIPGVLVCYHYLREQGLSIDLKRLRRLMRENGLALLSQCYRFRNAPIGVITEGFSFMTDVGTFDGVSTVMDLNL